MNGTTQSAAGGRFRPMATAARLAVAAVLALVAAAPETARAQAASCESSGLDPTDGRGNRLLGRFYERADGVGGLGCWIHRHANGRDAVVTPFSWGTAPEPALQARIDIVLESMTKARERLAEYGTLGDDLLYLLTDLPVTADANWPNEGLCTMEHGTQRHPMWREHPEDALRDTAAHEIGHCFIMDNIPGYAPDNYDSEIDKWWDESGAVYYSTIIEPDLNHEHEDALDFDLDILPFIQPYSGFIVLQHYANTFGADQVISLLRDIHDQRSAEALLAFMRERELDAFFHEFAMTHYFELVVDPSGGALPREPEVTALYEAALTPEMTRLGLPSIPHSSLSIADIILPAEFKLILSPPLTEGDRLFGSALVGEEFIRDWNEPIELGADCDADRTIRLFFTHLNNEPLEGLSMFTRLDHDIVCAGCVRPGRTLSPEEYGEGTEACFLRCTDRCWCENQSMWEDRPVTLAECNRLYPGGQERSHPRLPTNCELMAERASARSVLNVHCGVECNRQCGGVADPP